MVWLTKRVSKFTPKKFYEVDPKFTKPFFSTIDMSSASNCRPVFLFIFFIFEELNSNGIACFEKCKQLLEYQNLLLISDICLLKF